MIVDDEPITARGYARALTSAGYHVTVASAGREGATLARSKRFDAIVSDISMPDMDGLALLRDIRQIDLDAHRFAFGGRALASLAENFDNLLRLFVSRCELGGARRVKDHDGEQNYKKGRERKMFRRGQTARNIILY
jgi:hypothetical protein